MSELKLYAFADEASGTLEGQIAAMLRNSLRGLEIRGVDGENVSAITLDKAREIKRRLDDAGLQVWSIGSPIGKIVLEQDDFAAHVEVFRHTLDVARLLDAANLRVFSFYIPAGHAPELYRQQVIDRLGQLLEIAADSGVTLCHENEKGIYGDIAPRCHDLLTALPALMGVFDPANFVQCGQDTWEAWTLLAPRIKYMHIKDALADGRVVPPGQGIGQVRRVIEAYRAQGGSALSIEPHLTEFVGLSGLERDGEKSVVGGLRFDSHDAAFDAACAALQSLLSASSAR